MGADEMTKVGQKYWIWLAQSLGAGAKTEEVFSVFKSPLDVYNASEKDRSAAGVFSKSQCKRLSEYTLEDAEKIISVCRRNSWNIITPEDTLYPAGLRRISDMPLALYVDGDISCLRGKVMIGVVGTRNPGLEGITVTHNICTDMSAAGAVIVSGGALGIDSAAHESALFAGGKTVCVLGCGLGTRYLMENEVLRRDISRNGAVVTEYPPYASASKYSFPTRNRIISGMSHAVLVVEAGEKSCSLITARTANEQGREVFAVPGNVLTSAYTGANRLISAGEAKVAMNANDILSPFALMYPDRLNLGMTGRLKYGEYPDKNEIPDGLSPDMEAVYRCLGKEPVHFDEIVAKTGLSNAKAVTAIINLELMDYITETESKKYIIN